MCQSTGMRSLFLFVSVFALLACETDDPAPPPPTDTSGVDGGARDAGMLDAARQDSGAMDADIDSSVDAGPGEDTATDAGAQDSATPDAGPMVPRIDGLIGEDEWAGAVRVADVTLSSTGTPFEGNALRALLVLRTEERLYLAVDADLTDGNALLVYIDGDVGGGEGVVNTSELGDLVGALDAAFSTKTVLLPSEFRLDQVWGTLDMGRALTADDDRMGWRDVSTNPSLFRAFTPDVSASVCSAAACEASVRLDELGTLGTIGVFVRLGSATTANLSNQTLPMDADPEFVTIFLEAP